MLVAITLDLDDLLHRLHDERSADGLVESTAWWVNDRHGIS